MAEDSPVAPTTKGQEKDGRHLRGAIVPAITFIAGIVSALLIQWFVGHQQLLHAERETRVAALRDYTSACYSDAISFSELANLPLHFEAIGNDPGLSARERTHQAFQLREDSLEREHKTAANLAVQAEIVNALFQTKVDPVGVVMKDVPPEFNVLPGQVDPEKLIQRMQQDPLVELKKYAALLGRQSTTLSDYCQESVQALAKEID